MKRFEPFFTRWSLVKVLQSDQTQHQGHNRFQHKTCLAFVEITPDLVPPMVCPGCGADCVKEAALEERLKNEGAVLLDAPQKPIQVSPEDFAPGKIT